MKMFKVFGFILLAGSLNAHPGVETDGCAKIKERGLWSQSEIDQGSYKLRTLVDKQGELCKSNNDYWVKYTPPVTTHIVVSPAQLQVEDSICRKSFQLQTVIDEFRFASHRYLIVENASLTGQLTRPIICDPNSYKEVFR